MNLRTLTVHDLMRWLLLSLIVLVPWIYSAEFESSFTVTKLTVLRLITLAMAGLWLTQIVGERRLTYRRSPLNRWILAYAGILVLTTLTSTYFWTSFFGDSSRFLGLMTMLNLLFLVLVTLNFIQSKQEVIRYAQVSVFNAVALAIYGVLQWKGWINTEEWIYDPTFRVFGTMGHSNHFGAYLAFHAMIVLGLLFRSPHRLIQLAYSLTLLPIILALLATASRGALLAFVFALIVFVIGLVARRWEWIIEQKKWVGTGIAVLLIAGAVFFNPLATQIRTLTVTQRILDTVEFMQAGNLPDRVSWWLSSLAMIKDQPLLGHGLSTFHALYNLYRRTDYRVPGDIQDTFTPETAHMEYFDIAVTQGLLGLIVYLGLLFAWARLLWKTMRHPDVSISYKMLALGFFSAGVVYLFQVLLSFGVVATLVPFFILLGMSATLYHVTADPKPQSEQFHRAKIKGGALWAWVIVVPLLWMFSFWFTIRQASAEWWLDKALDSKKSGEVALSLQRHQKATNAMPWMSIYWENYGQTTFDFSGYDTELEIMKSLMGTSIGAYEVAYRLSPTLPHIPANLAIVHLTLAELLEEEGDSKNAEIHQTQGINIYEQAVGVAVNNPLFAYNYGIILRSLKRYDDALLAFEKVLTIRDPYKDTFYQIAVLATELKDYDKARLYIQSALAENPADENIKILLQRINSETSHEP